MVDSPRAAILPIIAARPQIPGTIETVETNVPMVKLPQASSSVSRSAGGMPISHTAEQQYTLAQPHANGPATNGTGANGYATNGLCCEWLCHKRLCSKLSHEGVLAVFGHANDCHAMLSMASSSTMKVKHNQLGFMSAPLNIHGTQFQGSYNMPNPGWQLSSREHLFQDQLQREHQGFQEFQAWKLKNDFCKIFFLPYISPCLMLLGRCRFHPEKTSRERVWR